MPIFYVFSKWIPGFICKADLKLSNFLFLPIGHSNNFFIVWKSAPGSLEKGCGQEEGKKAEKYFLQIYPIGY